MANNSKTLTRIALLAMMSSSIALQSAFAQDSQPADDIETVPAAAETGETTDEGLVVTGSRLRRSEYDSPRPLRILTTEEARQEGNFTAADILQQSSIAGGVNFDATFTGFVTDSGPGSATLNLRGLGADRNLILLNGRRLAPAGVGGAPSRPDLNLIPSGIVEQFDVLLDGASSVYGSDAVTGVVNVIIRNDFEGADFTFSASSPEDGGGEELQGTFTGGLSNDRGNIIFGAEYYERKAVKRGDRDFTPCIRDIEVNPSTGQRAEICTDPTFANMFLDPANLFVGDVFDTGQGADFGEYWYDFDNGGFFYNPTNNAAGGPGDEVTNLADPDGPTVLGISTTFPYTNERNLNFTSDEFDLVQGIQRFSLYSGGEYALTDRVDVYFETLYSSRFQTIETGAFQIFPSIPCSNPIIQSDPVLSSTPACSFLPAIGFGDSGFDELVWLPLISSVGGQIAEVEVSQVRGVLGFKGDLDFIIPPGRFVTDGAFGLNLDNWTWDIYASYDRSNGNLSSPSINEERLTASIRNVEVDPDTGEFVCTGFAEDDLFGFISGEPCVPLNILDPAIYETGQLPADFVAYAVGNATNRTVITQSLINGVIAGDLFRLPDGVVPFVLGFEYREDTIESYNDFLTTSGSGTVAREGNTFGTTDLLEVFLETELPLLRGRPFAEELTFNASGRWTEEKNFGALWTYGFNVNYLPFDWLRLRATTGTTFKAPNLRQQFLAGQQSFANAFLDPCINSVFDDFDDDPATQAILRANCEAQGADPDTLGIGGAPSISVTSGGNGQDLDPETSENYTLGFAVEQPIFDAFDLSLSVTYYSYEIEDSIVAPSASFILADCLIDNAGLSSPFCRRIERNDTGDPGLNFISNLDASFLNVGNESAKGFDVSVNYEQEFTVLQRPLNLSVTMRANKTTEREETIFDIFEDFLGEFGTPEWRGDFRARVDYADFAVTWTTDYIGSVVEDDIDAVRTDDFYNFQNCTVTTTGANGQITGVDPASCGDPVFAAGFRDVEEADEYFVHDLSVNYSRDTWGITLGIRNLFNEEPPLVDDGEVPATSANVPLGYGYDVFGRTFFLTLDKSF